MVKIQPFFSNFAVTLSFVVLFLGCSPKVVHFTNENSTFNQYNTFGIVNIKITKTPSSNTGDPQIKAIEDEINAQMIRRGYTVAQSPSLIVRYEYISKQITKNNSNNYYGNPYASPSSNFNVTSNESALIIEIVDPKVKKSIWQASIDLKSKNKKQSQLDNLKNNVGILFNTYLHRANTSETDKTLTKTND
jgi:hypothetical protein